MRKAIAKQGAEPLPSLPRGHFSVVCNFSGHQVAIFHYDKTTGCRSTKAAEHDELQGDKRVNPSIRVGHEYLFGYSLGYAVSNGKINLDPCLPTARVSKLSENARTIALVAKLREHYTSADICGLGRDSSHFCSFSGGGDIQIFNKVASSAAVVRLSGEEDDDSESPEQTVRSPTDIPRDTLNVTPPSRGESRCGSVENNVSAQQTEEDVRLQLQANMLVTHKSSEGEYNTRRARVDPYPVLLWHATGPSVYTKAFEADIQVWTARTPVRRTVSFGSVLSFSCLCRYPHGIYV